MRGTPNKLTKAVKDMILGALEELGGETWLVTQAKANPAAFMSLVGKVIPHEVVGPGGGAVVHKVEVTFV